MVQRRHRQEAHRDDLVHLTRQETEPDVSVAPDFDLLFLLGGGQLGMVVLQRARHSLEDLGVGSALTVRVTAWRTWGLVVL